MNNRKAGTGAGVETLRKLMSRERVREAQLKREAMEQPPLSTAEAHQSVSNRVRATQSMAFEPSFGALGKPSDAEAAPGIREAIATPPPASPPKPEAAAEATEVLDAYYGSFGGAEDRTELKGVPEAALEVVIGPDDRVEVTNTEAYPWRCICSLRINAADGRSFIGTGWLVSPRVVLTAGHCVYMHDAGGWPTSIEVIPGRRGTHMPYGSVTTNVVRSVRGWTESRDSDFDYGAILLPEGNRYGDQLGWLGYSTRTDSELETGVVNLSGYPGDKPSGTQWFHSLAVDNHTDKKFTYQIDTFGGQSGAPVWQLLSDGGRYGVGIHTSGHLSGNSATRINSEVFDNIVNWIGQAP